MSYNRGKNWKTNSNTKVFVNGIGMNMIHYPNGLKSNEVLNKMVDRNETMFKDLELNTRFEISHSDGLWELTIKNPKRNIGMVLKENPYMKDHQKVFLYLRKIDGDGCQWKEDIKYDIPNNKLDKFIYVSSQQIS
jgi:hypothetical protein